MSTLDNPPFSVDSVGWTHPFHARLATPEHPFHLHLGGQLDEVNVEYEMYGLLNAARSNVILVEHSLTADAHAAGWDTTITEPRRNFRKRKPGWWEEMIGPGKPLDTHRFCVICSNVLGSCYGTTGPISIDPATGKQYGLNFPRVTITDWVRLQARLMDHLEIAQIHTVIGGSLGGQQALEWALAFPDRVKRSIVLASAPALSAQGLAFNAVGRHAILTDPNFNNGDYYDRLHPLAGLAMARMLAHITYLSEPAMQEKFGRRPIAQPRTGNPWLEYDVEGYLDYQGSTFVERFDANTYLLMTKAMDQYDAAKQWGGGVLAEACRRVQANLLVVSFTSDWLYPPSASEELAEALRHTGKNGRHVNVDTPYGHDAFLVEADRVGQLVRDYVSEG